MCATTIVLVPAGCLTSSWLAVHFESMATHTTDIASVDTSSDEAPKGGWFERAYGIHGMLFEQRYQRMCHDLDLGGTPESL